MNRIQRITIACALLAALSVCAYGQGGKVLHFPADRSVGKIYIQDADFRREIKSFFYWTDDGEKWEYYCPAKGSVRIPAGKVVKLITNWNRKPEPEDLSKLKPDDLYSLVVQCGMDKRLRAGDSYIESVGRLTGLKALDIDDSNVTSRGLFKIRKLEGLERLSLGERISNSGMRVVVSFKSLKGLYLKACRITDIGLAKICENLSLEELALSGKKLSDEGLAHLAKIGTLKYLMLSGNNFTDEGVAHLKNVKSLKILNGMGLNNITDAGVKHLSEHPGLERISFSKSENITNEGARHLSQMRSLKMLDVTHSKIDDIGIGYLSQCKAMEQIVLPTTGITDVGLKHLSTIDGLKVLGISRPWYVDPKMDVDHYTDEGLKDIGKLVELEELKIGGIGVTDAGMEHIAKLRKLKKLMLFGCLITDKGLEKLTTLKSLDDLYVHKSKITMSGLKSLNELTNMKRLNLKPVIQDHSVMDLSGLKNLEYLTIGTPSRSKDLLTDADLACLAKLKKLKWFQISCIRSRNEMDISGEGLKHLAGLPDIDRLCLGGPNLKDEDFRHFSNMKKLTVLSVYGGGLTDACLKHLETVPQLSNLNIYMENDITDEALGRLQAKLPNLSSIRIHRDENKSKKN